MRGGPPRPGRAPPQCLHFWAERGAHSARNLKQIDHFQCRPRGAGCRCSLAEIEFEIRYFARLPSALRCAVRPLVASFERRRRRRAAFPPIPPPRWL